MSNSRLCTYKDINHTNWSNRKYGISRITIHVAAGDLSFGRYSSTIRGRECSWNYAVQSDGKVGLFVEECNRAWTTGGSDPRGAENDHRAVTMEVSNRWGANTGYKVTDSALNAVIDLCEDICRRNGKKTLIWFGDVERSEAYSPKSHEMVMTVHRWYANKSCPGDYLYGKQSYIAKTVTTRLGGPNTITYPDGSVISAYDSVSSGTSRYYVDPTKIIDTSALSPYIVTTSRKTGKLDYTQLKKLGVTGAIIESGQYFDTVHKEADIISYRNPKLISQVSEAVAAEVPYGYWHPVKARSTDEARREVTALTRVVQLWAPQIGVWLKLELVKSKTINDAILNVYREALEDVGLKGQIGVYCNKDQLKKVSWDKHQDNFLLWLDDHLTSSFDVDELLVPGFFNVVI